VYVVIMRGPPGSGKSTQAAEMQRFDQDAVIVNRDRLRQMLHGERAYSEEDEEVTRAARNGVIRAALRLHRNVIVDDTNINPLAVQTLREIAIAHGATVSIIDMLTDVEICIERDAGRPAPARVGPDVIRKMAAEHTQQLANERKDNR
jgi:predicted kinase